MFVANGVIEQMAAFAGRRMLDDDFCAVLMFHHVAEHRPNKLRLNDHLRVSPTFLSRIIRDMKGEGYAFISMDELTENLEKNRRMSKTIALTFDDGYADNFTVGRQVLESEDVPGIVYVATGLGTPAAPIWWDALEEYVLSVDEFTMPSGRSVRCETVREKECAFMALRDWVLSLEPEKIRCSIANQCSRSLEWVDMFGCQMASRETIRCFSSDHTLSIGSHTHCHLPCGRLPNSVVEADFRKSLECLSSCGVKVRHFAFPYGDDESNAERFASVFAATGIRSAVTTYSGVVRTAMSSRYFLPRIFVSEYDGFSDRVIYSAYSRGVLRNTMRLMGLQRICCGS